MNDYHKPKYTQDADAKVESNKKNIKKLEQEQKEANQRLIKNYYGGTNPND